jgi:hypothetical protein
MVARDRRFRLSRERRRTRVPTAASLIETCRSKSGRKPETLQNRVDGGHELAGGLPVDLIISAVGIDHVVIDFVLWWSDVSAQ